MGVDEVIHSHYYYDRAHLEVRQKDCKQNCHTQFLGQNLMHSFMCARIKFHI
jgi:hypothetical protein